MSMVASGKMRDRTDSEALDWAHSQALSDGNLKAAAALKTAAGDKWLKLGANDMLFNTTTGQSGVTNTAGEKIKTEGLESQERWTALVEQGRNDRTKADNDARAEIETNRLKMGGC